MWKQEIAPIAKRLRARITLMRSHFNDDSLTNDTRTLNTHLSITKSLVEKLNDIKEAVGKKLKSYENSDVEDLTELLLDADEVIAEAQVLLKEQESLSLTQKATVLTSTSAAASSKLPKLDLPKFNGDIVKFSEFWELFELSVNQPNISATHKFLYLKAALTEEAAKLIEGLSVTAANYNIAVKLLKEKYSNHQQVIQRLYHKLQKLPTACEKMESLRETYDQIETILRSLEALKESVENGAVLALLTQKFPHNVLVKVGEVTGTDKDVTVSGFRASMRKIILDKEKFATFQSLTAMNTTRTPTVDALLTKPIAVKKQCIYCNQQSHWSDQCKIYPTMEKRKEKIKGSCFICLKQGHNLKSCKVFKACVYCHKKGNHHRSLCPQQFTNCHKTSEADQSSPTTPPIHQSTKAETQTESHKTTTCLVTDHEATLLTATTNIINGNKAKKVRIIFDNGSLRSYITRRLQNALCLPTMHKEALNISTFNDTNPKYIETTVVTLSMPLKNGTFFEMTVNTVPKISDTTPISIPQEIKAVASANNITLADDESECDIDILIGIDYYFQLVTEHRMKVNESLYFIHSQLGWLLGGSWSTESSNPMPVSCLLVQNNGVNPVEEIKSLWELDTLGIKNIEDKDDDQALAEFYRNISFHNGQYTVAWPWKYYPPNLPSNYELAYGRLKSQHKRMDQDLLEKYNNIIEKQLKDEVIEVVEQSNTNAVTHYLPHHPVLTPGKSTECRIVYDGSAKTKRSNKSLNDCLYKGKILLEDVCAIFLRFRLHKIGIIADIEKAFLQLNLHIRDRDTVRFLWIKDLQKPVSEDNLQVYRFRKIPFGVISSPSLLSLTIHHHLITNSESEFTLKLLPNFYVDNLITGASSQEEGESLYKYAKEIFKAASMNLRDWKSNSKQLNEIFTDDQHQSTELSVLGIMWNTNTDNLQLKSPPLCHKSLTGDEITKRTILKITAAHFDPMGWFAPVILPAKILIKELWEKGKDWDEVLSADEQDRWFHIFKELSQLSTYPIQRLIGTTHTATKSAMLHVFVDASQNAYGAVVYLQLFTTEEKNEVFLLFAKARVAPKKNSLTIPRLELLAVLIGVRLVQFIHKAIASIVNIQHTYLWSDSKCVLHWIRSQKVLSTFVENRIQEIRKNKNIEYRYVPSNENIADIASRGAKLEELGPSWWMGPKFLQLPKSQWPQNEIATAEDSEIQTEVFLVNNRKVEPIICENQYGIVLTDYDDINTLLFATARASRQKNENQDVVTIDEVNAARTLWIRAVQEAYFPDIVNNTQNKNSQLLRKQLGLWTDQDEIWRCSGRMIYSELTEEEKFPILLPSKCHYTTLEILDCHKKLFHAGTSHVLTELRKRFWILRGRATVYNTLKRHCFNCNFFQNAPYKAPPMAPLPSFRSNSSTPFETVGMDVFGPLFVKKKKDATSRKMWCLLFTCFVTRAIHLELLADLTADEFLMSIRCFVARRGTPRLIVTDNAPQFKLLSTVFENQCHEMIIAEPTQHYLLTQGIRWKFIPPSAPWMGGAYERLVGIVKLSLKKTLFTDCISQRQLQTLLTEIEAVVNSRPLLYAGESFPDTVLTPANLIMYRRNQQPLTPSELRMPSRTTTEREVTTLWKKTQKILQQFWVIWRTSYLQSLRERYQNINKRASRIKPKEGDVVLVSENTSRLHWPTAKITKLIPSTDGEIRTAEIQTDTGLITIRPIAKLIPLGLEFTSDTVAEETQSSTPMVSGSPEATPPQSEVNQEDEDYEVIENTIEGLDF